MKQTFTDTVEIDAPTQVGLVVTGPATGVGAGAQLMTTGTGGRGWEILATGHTAAQGSDKLNIARQTVTSFGYLPKMSSQIEARISYRTKRLWRPSIVNQHEREPTVRGSFTR